MGLTIADTYYLKAKAASGYDWDEVCESLNYALSYNENHCASLCLLGKIYARNLNRYEEAFDCFDKIIAIDSNYTDVYPIYAKYLIWADELERANKLISFAFTIKGISKAYTLEIKQDYKIALKSLKKAKRHTYNDDYFSFIENEESRIKKKLKLDKTKKSSSKKGKKKKK